ncbi:hypothetical protein, partial [Pseudomonas aeruginosa]|uniref:hypothetical protein n=1 Tax=Pseudomonas aeruginosa TaxID=287 RepID=UPI001C131161
RPKRLKKRQTGRVGAVEAEFFNGLLENGDWLGLCGGIKKAGLWPAFLGWGWLTSDKPRLP